MDSTDVPTLIVSVIVAVISVTALFLSILQQRQARIESVIEGLRGDRRAVTYAALTIRLSKLLKRDDYRRSLIASLLLAWNFETSHRARSAVLAALVHASSDYKTDYDAAVEDLGARFESYKAAHPAAKIERGVSRLGDVTQAVEVASGRAPAPKAKPSGATSPSEE